MITHCRRSVRLHKRIRTAPRRLFFALLVALAPAFAQGELLWFEQGRLTPQARELIASMQSAERVGLRAEDYALRERMPTQFEDARLDIETQSQIDAALSARAGAFLQHLQFGRVTAKQAGFEFPAPTLPDPMIAVRALAQARDVRTALADLEPRALPYRLLKSALTEYRELASRPWPTLSPISRSLRAGDAYADAPKIRQTLATLGDLPLHDADNDTAVLDDTLVAALERFQRRHGLDPDGVLGKQTYAALTTPLSKRVEQIELTMERWRWTAALERPDIVVNIPQFMLFALPRDAGEKPIEMPVVVGQTVPHMRTPAFTGKLRYVVFQPYWDVPTSIVRREILPRVRKDPGYLDRQEMELVRGQSDNSPVVPTTPEAIEELAAGKLRLRQRPGPKNSLGPIKFMLPNPYNVYLHATPATELFGRSRRAFSHGCVRVSDPARLALYVLKNAADAWDEARIETALCATSMQRVNLVEPLQVLLFYGTAVATQTSGMLFADDLYGHDARLAAELAKRQYRTR